MDTMINLAQVQWSNHPHLSFTTPEGQSTDSKSEINKAKNEGEGFGSRKGSREAKVERNNT